MFHLKTLLVVECRKTNLWEESDEGKASKKSYYKGIMISTFSNCGLNKLLRLYFPSLLEVVHVKL